MDPTALGTHIVITGAMGVGKSTVGKLLAAELGMAFFDSDEVLEAKTGRSGSEIAAREGVERLHRLELEVFLESCREREVAVIASAASVVDQESGREALANNLTVWLTAPSHDLAARRSAGSHRRPIGTVEQQDLERARAPMLEQVSAITLDTGSVTPKEVVRSLIDQLPEAVVG